MKFKVGQILSSNEVDFLIEIVEVSEETGTYSAKRLCDNLLIPSILEKGLIISGWKLITKLDKALK